MIRRSRLVGLIVLLAAVGARGSDGRGPYNVAIWLVPGEEQQRQIQRIISDLAAAHSSNAHYIPVFQPHATLCTGELNSENLGEELRALFGQVDDFATSYQEVSLAVQGVDHRSNKWSQFLFLALDRTAAPAQLLDPAKTKARFSAIADCAPPMDAADPQHPMPHVSLMYNTDDSSYGAIEKDVKNKNLPGQLIFESIQVVMLRSGNWDDILKRDPRASWDIVYARKLLPAEPPLRMVMAGGQTGVDQASWRAARLNRILIGGWCPPNRYLGRGQWVPREFPCEETPHDRDDASVTARDIPRSERTEWNVRDSDATLILRPLGQRCVEPKQWLDVPPDMRLELEKDPGTKLTIELALTLGKHPMLCDPDNIQNVDQVFYWVKNNNVRTLNVGGPSDATQPGIGTQAEQFLLKVFAKVRADK